jgi:TatD DNase family protein
MIIDAHCHLDLYSNPFEVARHCKQKNLQIISVTTTPTAWRGTLKLAKGNSQIHTALGLHPQLAHERYHELDIFDSLLSETKYVGEIGLDEGKHYKEYIDKQLYVFRHILDRISKTEEKIISIHSRFSATSIFNELERYPNIGIPIMHWFTGNKTELKKLINLGCWFSIGIGMANTKKGKDCIKIIPSHKIITESDAPFSRYKGNIIMPWEMLPTIKILSDIWNISVDEAMNRIKENFKLLSLYN